MENIKLFRVKINSINKKYGLVLNQLPNHTHLISLSFEINGNTFTTPSRPLSPQEFRKVYQELKNEILTQYKQYKMINE